jgi:hypothetical protein
LIQKRKNTAHASTMDGNMLMNLDAHRSQEDIRILDDDLCQSELRAEGLSSEGMIMTC